MVTADLATDLTPIAASTRKRGGGTRVCRRFCWCQSLLFGLIFRVGAQNKISPNRPRFTRCISNKLQHQRTPTPRHAPPLPAPKTRGPVRTYPTSINPCLPRISSLREDLSASHSRINRDSRTKDKRTNHKSQITKNSKKKQKYYSACMR